MLFPVKPYFKLVLATLAATLVLAGCSTKNNALINRAFHNLAARDNGYFNAKEKMKAAEQELYDTYTDRYDRILDVFKLPDDAKAKTMATAMDEIIKKSSNVINRHSMLIMGKEYNKWIDENYLLIGKAHFYKRDFQQAKENFEYVAAQFKEEPTKYDAFLMLAQTYLARQLYADAESVLDYLSSEGKLPKRLKGSLAATYSWHYISLKKYDKAIEELERAIKFTNKRSDKTRYIFILAQLKQRELSNKKAFELYGMVIKRNPVYEMSFNAKINQARCFDMKSGKSEQIRKQLLKMLNDEKNKEYRDQIYYALGQMSLVRKKTDDAIDYFKLSVRACVNNNSQKAFSFLELGNVYFAKPNYRLAQAYYDSTISFLPKDHPDYQDIFEKKNTLSRLVKYMHTIEVEDSLQKIAAMNPKERDAYIEMAIAKRIADEEKRKREELAKKQQNTILNTGTTTGTTAGAQSGGWYFYNPQTLSFGFNDFVKKWGNRISEDNWRRSNKENNAESNATDAVTGGGKNNKAEADSNSDLAITDIKDKKQYYRNIPLGPMQIKRSNQRMTDAYYNMTILYKEQLGDNKESANSGEKMLKRFPDNEYKQAIYYNLYRVYLAMGNMERSNYYRDLLLNNYPESDYAQLIKDPDFLKKSQGELSKVNTYYRETFELYEQGKYDEVAARTAQAQQLFPANALKPKFDYLNALVIGHTKGLDPFVDALNGVIKNHPNTDVQKQAKETLGYILAMKDRPMENDSTKSKPKDIYVLSPDSAHYYVVAIKTTGFNTNGLKSRITNHNEKNYGSVPMEIIASTLGDEAELLTVKSFTDKESSQDYLYLLKDSKEVFGELTGVVQFVISTVNYRILLQDKDLAKYMVFYTLNYPEIAHF